MKSARHFSSNTCKSAPLCYAIRFLLLNTERASLSSPCSKKSLSSSLDRGLAASATSSVSCVATFVLAGRALWPHVRNKTNSGAVFNFPKSVPKKCHNSPYISEAETSRDLETEEGKNGGNRAASDSDGLGGGGLQEKTTSSPTRARGRKKINCGLLSVTT